MTLKQLKECAERYAKLDGDMTQETFHCAILAFLDTATSDDYMAFALWLVEQEKGQGH